MKRHIFILALLFCWVIKLNAQVNHGVKVGIEVVNFTGSEVQSSNFIPAFTGGYFLNYEIMIVAAM